MTDWTQTPFIDYLNAVDDLIEARIGNTTTQRDSERIAAAQEAGDTPQQCAQALRRLLTIRTLNDRLRKRAGVPFFGRSQDRIVITQGIAALAPHDQLEAIARVRDFEDFSDDNDPHGEHDFGSFDQGGQTIFWKIDYYDAALEQGSEDPADPEQTARVLTILLADEW
jgi:hypothetical protein